MEIVIPDRIRLVDVIGRPARRGAFLFVPTLFDNTEWMYSSEEYALPLHRCIRVPSGSRRVVRRKDRTAISWAVGTRIASPSSLGLPRQPSLKERMSIGVALVISEQDDRYEAVAFVLTDIGLEPELEFFRDTDPSAATQIASEFWGLFLAEPQEFASFRTELLLEYDQDCICPVEVGYWGDRFRVYYSVDPLTCQPM